jgi:hypothetical protein
MRKRVARASIFVIEGAPLGHGYYSLNSAVYNHGLLARHNLDGRLSHNRTTSPGFMQSATES